MSKNEGNRVSMDFDPNLTIAEGSDVVLDAYDFVKYNIPGDEKTSFFTTGVN